MMDKQRYQINWSMEGLGLGRDERTYFRGLLKVLMREGVLCKVPTKSQVRVRDEIVGLLSTIEFAPAYEHPKRTIWFANQIMGIVNRELL